MGRTERKTGGLQTTVGLVMQVVLGLGCDRNTSLETISKAVELALESLKLSKSDVVGLATIDKKSDEVALVALATSFDLGLTFYTAEELAKVEVPNPSAVVLKYMGTPSVSEAAAVLLGQSLQKNRSQADLVKDQLVLEKLKHKGQDTKNATVSVLKIVTP